MRYELLLQPTTPGEPFPADVVDAKLAEVGVVGEAGADRSWPLKSGKVEVRSLLENGLIVATELRVPLSDKLELIRELVIAASGVAAASGVTLLDLQLNRPVNERDADDVATRYFEAARYAGEMHGVAEAIPASFAAPTPTGLKSGTKVLLAIIALFLLVVWLTDLIL